MQIQNFSKSNFMAIIFAVVGAVSIVLITYWYGITANSITIVVAIAMIAMMAITTAVTERAIRDTSQNSLSTLKNMELAIKEMSTNQGKFFSSIYRILNAPPIISLRKEKRPYRLGFEHYYLWIYNTGGRKVMIKIDPKPSDSSGRYATSQPSEAFFINDYGALERDHTIRSTTISCYGYNGKKYKGTIKLKDISEDEPIDVELKEV